MDQIGADGKPVTVIHFVHRLDGVDKEQDWRIACMPNMVEFHRTPYHPNSSVMRGLTSATQAESQYKRPSR